MLLRSVATVVAVAVACVLFPRSDADARGGGGFHGGMAAAFHMRAGHFGFQRDGPPMHGDMRRAMRRDMRTNHPHNARRNNLDGQGGSHHFARAEFGRWHRWAGFGSSRMSSMADGQWHAGGTIR